MLQTILNHLAQHSWAEIVAEVGAALAGAGSTAVLLRRVIVAIFGYRMVVIRLLALSKALAPVMGEIKYAIPFLTTDDEAKEFLGLATTDTPALPAKEGK